MLYIRCRKGERKRPVPSSMPERFDYHHLRLFSIPSHKGGRIEKNLMGLSRNIRLQIFNSIVAL